MQTQLLDNDASGLEKSLREMLAYVPYQLHIGKEAYYHSLLLVWLKLMGFDVAGEVSTNKGRIDTILKLNEHTVIAEIKYQPQEEALDSLLDASMKQIREKQYAERYDNGQKVSLLAVAFAGKEIGCRIE
jgi:Holliday junction resolvase-like predicted endonuclease